MNWNCIELKQCDYFTISIDDNKIYLCVYMFRSSLCAFQCYFIVCKTAFCVISYINLTVFLEKPKYNILCVLLPNICNISNDTLYDEITNANAYINHGSILMEKLPLLSVIKHLLNENMHRIYKIHKREEYY